MNIRTDSSNNINFSAKLNIRQVRADKEKWKEIARIFQKKTSDYPKDKFSISGSPNSMIFMGVLNEDNLYDWLLATLEKSEAPKFFSLPAKTIADKLSDLFHFFKRKEQIMDAASDSFAPSGLPKDTGKSEIEIMRAALEGVEAERKKYLGKDELFNEKLKIW